MTFSLLVLDDSVHHVDSSNVNNEQRMYSCDRSRQSNLHSVTNSDARCTRQRPWWTIGLFSASTVLLFADQNLMSPNLTAIANEFGFSDEERDKKLGGQIALAFFVLGAPASFIVGCLGDHYNRSLLFAGTVGIGEGACLATYFTRTYPQLYACRAITGFSLGGALPLIYSMLGDLFAAQERHAVSAVVGVGTGIGISLGQGVAGFLGPRFGWRFPFLLISIPALICACMVFLWIEDPPRGAMEEAVSGRNERSNVSQRKILRNNVEMVPLPTDETSDPLSPNNSDRGASLPFDAGGAFHLHVHWSSFCNLLSTPTVLLSLFQGAPGCIPWGIVNTYLNDFLSQDRGMTVEFATLTILCFGAGNFVGMLVGGGAGTWLYMRNRRYPALLAGLAALGSCLPFWILLNFVDSATFLVWIVLVSVVAGALSGITGPIIKATLQNVTLPQSRGQAFALFNTFDDFGRGLGPVFVAAMIGRLGGRTMAFNVGVLGWALCGIFNVLIFFTVERDEAAVQATLATQVLSRNSYVLHTQHDGDDNETVEGLPDDATGDSLRPVNEEYTRTLV